VNWSVLAVIACLVVVGILKTTGWLDASMVDTIVAFILGGGAGLAIGYRIPFHPTDDRD
jgi:hypothetical protein